MGDSRAIPRCTAAGGGPVRLGDVATIQIGPEMRRGIAELNGEGEVAGGVVILRSGKNARESIAAVKDKLADLRKSLPPGRSEEHTSELQSLMRISYAVFCLKKNNN